MVDCESVEDERGLSSEPGEEDSHQLDSSSRIEAGEGGYSCPMDASEFDSVASASRQDKEAVPTCSRANEEDVDCGRFSVAEDVDSVTGSGMEDVDSVAGSVMEEVDSVT